MRRLRREGDPTNLVLWFATVVYLLVVAIPLYFPDVFGIEGRIGVVFAHNAFTVQFLYERLPLYIVALYPAVTMLAFEIVRTLGVFRDRGILVGAVCVGFVHHCFYEVFDQLGPSYFGATGGITDDGTPIGNLIYATLCLVIAAMCVAAAADRDVTVVAHAAC